ncbi:cytochrome c biogenesis heme-transporting ATPase CcmA [Alcanivorax sp. 1008]|uniref:cytochrome c biogenesis heme-transporting ATPase CcmA n=1 Tax=Alcanivorax sp. 1008 TaxID=2816853 RepID=UPI001E5B30F6
MTDLPLLQADKLTCERDDRVLFDGLSFAARAGEVWQLAGPNGSGKTTLMRIIAGLHGDFSGHVDWPAARSAGQDPRQQLLTIGHRPGLRVELTALENLRWWLALHQCVLDVAQAEQALSRVGLAGYETVPVAQMSAGQTRRVALSMLWLVNKSVWLLDEPFTALDVDGVALIEARLRELADAGALVLYSSHHRVNGDARQIRLGDGRGEVR